MNWQIIFHRLHWVLGGISIVLILPTSYTLFEDVSSAPAYLLPSAICLILGFLLNIKNVRFYSVQSRQNVIDAFWQEQNQKLEKFEGNLREIREMVRKLDFKS